MNSKALYCTMVGRGTIPLGRAEDLPRCPDVGRLSLWYKACAFVRSTRPVALARFWSKLRWSQPKKLIHVARPLTESDRPRVREIYDRLLAKKLEREALR